MPLLARPRVRSGGRLPPLWPGTRACSAMLSTRDRFRVGRVVEHLDRHPAARSRRPAAPGRSARSPSSPKPGPRRFASLAWKWPVRTPPCRRIRSRDRLRLADIALTSRCSTKLGWSATVERARQRVGAGVHEVGLGGDSGSRHSVTPQFLRASAATGVQRVCRQPVGLFARPPAGAGAGPASRRPSRRRRGRGSAGPARRGSPRSCGGRPRPGEVR